MTKWLIALATTVALVAPAPQIVPLPGNGSDEQMFGEE